MRSDWHIHQNRRHISLRWDAPPLTDPLPTAGGGAAHPSGKAPAAPTKQRELTYGNGRSTLGEDFCIFICKGNRSTGSNVLPKAKQQKKMTYFICNQKWLTDWRECRTIETVWFFFFLKFEGPRNMMQPVVVFGPSAASPRVALFQWLFILFCAVVIHVVKFTPTKHCVKNPGVWARIHK